MIIQRGKREPNPTKVAKQLADFDAVCRLMGQGVVMSKACAALKIHRSHFTKSLTPEQNRKIKELKHSMRGSGILKCGKRKGRN